VRAARAGTAGPIERGMDSMVGRTGER
jgi:hypothetical protein